jgi:hypothetical protein
MDVYLLLQRHQRGRFVEAYPVEYEGDEYDGGDDDYSSGTITFTKSGTYLLVSSNTEFIHEPNTFKLLSSTEIQITSHIYVSSNGGPWEIEGSTTQIMDIQKLTESECVLYWEEDEDEDRYKDHTTVNMTR